MMINDLPALTQDELDRYVESLTAGINRVAAAIAPPKPAYLSIYHYRDRRDAWRRQNGLLPPKGAA